MGKRGEDLVGCNDMKQGPCLHPSVCPKELSVKGQGRGAWRGSILLLNKVNSYACHF